MNGSPGPSDSPESGEHSLGLREVPVLARLPDLEFAELERTGEMRVVAPGTVLMEEGDQGDYVYFLLQGKLEVYGRWAGGEHDHRLAIREPGAVVGEIALLNDGPRTASVRAVAEARVFAVNIDRFRELSRRYRSIAQLLIDVATKVSNHFREVNQSTLAAMEGERQATELRLREAEARTQLGEFVVRLLAGVTLYMYLLGLASALVAVVSSATVVGLPILLGFATLVALFIRGSNLPAHAYGLTLEGAGQQALAGLAWSLPVLAVLLVTKGAMILTLPGGEEERLLDLGRHHDMSTAMFLGMGVVYSVLAPIQEFIARSGIQAPLSLYLTGPSARWRSILLAGLLFSATHLHVSAPLAVAVFPLGIYWGWLFDRHRTLVAVSVSHVFIGNVAFMVIGFDGFLR